MTASSTISRMMALALAGSMLAGSSLSGMALAATKKPAPATAPAEPALTREEARQHAADIFDKLDFNHDGVVNEADGKARREADLSAMFDRIDANHDGSISRAEFIAAHERPHGPGQERHGPMRPAMEGPGAPGGRHDEAERMAFSPMVFEILRQADPQRTGSVTKEAFIAAELKRFDEADANHDGKVTHEELRAARHERWERRDHGWRGDGPGRPWGPHGDMPPPPPPSAPPPADTAK